MHNIQVNDVKAIIPNNALFMKKLEKYKIALQAKFLKFKVKHFVEIPTIRHDKAVPPPPAWLTKIIFPPWMCPHPGSWSLAVAPLPGWWHKNHSPLPDPRGGGHYVTYVNIINKTVYCKCTCLDMNIKIIYNFKKAIASLKDE